MRFFLFFLLMLTATPALAQTDAERAEQALQNIGELLENRAALRAELKELEGKAEAEAALPTGEARRLRIGELNARSAEIEQLLPSSGVADALNTEKADLEAELKILNSATKSEAEARSARMAEINDELTKLNRQIGAVATGVSDEEYGIATDSKFDLNAEAQALVEPFIAMLRDATENARQIERLRRDLSEAKRRKALADRALSTLKPMRDIADEVRDVGGDRDGAQDLIETLDQRRALWEARANAESDLAGALRQQLDDRLSDRGASQTAAGEAASSFVKDRGISLLMGIAAFAFVFGVMRLLHRTARWLRMRRRIKRNFYTRLSNLIFTAFTPILAVTAMLTIFNMRNDWLLLGIFAIMLVALLWIGIRMIPEMIDQVTLLLNLGAVQEDERVIFDDTPYLVKRLDFYTDLENPALEGAEFTLPIKDLIGLHSRPSGPDEPWFPSRRGDWVRLADETFGQIISQSPDMVEIEIPGGSRVTYTHDDYLAEKPDNLSEGFRSEIVFGLSYRHQDIATGEAMEMLKDHIRDGLLKLVPEQHLLDVGCEMLEAGDNAIIYEVEADLTGAVAPLMEDVERELTRLCVDACTKFGWEIPFPQMVVHKA